MKQINVYVINGKEPLKKIEFKTETSGYEPFIKWSGDYMQICKKDPRGGSPFIIAGFNQHVYYEVLNESI